MINEEKVKEQFQLAVIDAHEQQSLNRTSTLFKSDYISKQMLTSFITGTICFCMLMALWVLWNMDLLMDKINSLDYLSLAVSAALYYAAFELVYLFGTAVVYLAKYHHDKKVSDKYAMHLKSLNKMYSREEKLKL